MGDHQRRAAVGQLGQRGLDGLLGLDVERRRGLVEDQDRRVSRKMRAIARRCRCPPESLTPRSPTTVETVRQARDHGVEPGAPGRLGDGGQGQGEAPSTLVRASLIVKDDRLAWAPDREAIHEARFLQTAHRFSSFNSPGRWQIG